MEQTTISTAGRAGERTGPFASGNGPASDSQTALRAQLAELACCLDRATFAIGANDVRVFEEALRQQQILCAEIGSKLRALIDVGFSLPQETELEVIGAANQNQKFLLLLQRVALHARALQRLYQGNLEADTRLVRVTGGRYV